MEAEDKRAIPAEVDLWMRWRAAAYELAFQQLERDEGSVNYKDADARVKSPPADKRRKIRVIALLEAAVQGISEDRFHPPKKIAAKRSWQGGLENYAHDQ